MPDLLTHFTSLDTGSQAMFLFRGPIRVKEGPALQYVCRRGPKAQNQFFVILKKCGVCGRVEELSGLFTIYGFIKTTRNDD